MVIQKKGKNKGNKNDNFKSFHYLKYNNCAKNVFLHKKNYYYTISCRVSYQHYRKLNKSLWSS